MRCGSANTANAEVLTLSRVVGFLLQFCERSDNIVLTAVCDESDSIRLRGFAGSSAIELRLFRANCNDAQRFECICAETGDVGEGKGRI